MDKFAKWWLRAASVPFLISLTTFTYNSSPGWTQTRQDFVRSVMEMNGWVSVALFFSSMVLVVVALFKQNKKGLIAGLIAVGLSALNLFFIGAGSA